MARKQGKYELDIKTRLLSRGLMVSTIALNPDLPEVERRRLAKISGFGFETLVFALGKNGELDRKRWTSKEQAVDGHKQVVTKWKTTPRKDVKAKLAKLTSF